ncbi:hypothetical protein TSOC_000478 [Tetrabaena socialis]|uniref:Uncharacterized protein n=1 Tax=Tetrabaena socialis TaxID=47790 RepID=A0A2J8AJ68_9CHLO|nr:hypothetical protein TSOC_000478 [Tetrabaena socialis]|eukprot:PNH12553.1 hypothetical protein TSOC_000478 [Tetrabaena socialis]
MPGGDGPHNLAPGQCTDDTELELSLMHALREHSQQQHLKHLETGTLEKDALLEIIAKKYIQWHRSDPFDIGHTCKRAFSACEDATGMLANALMYNQRSQANGALMRIAPLAVWGQGLPLDLIADLAKADAMLSHPNAITQEVNALYTMALVHLLQSPGDSAGAVQLVEEMITLQVVQDWYKTAMCAESPDDITGVNQNIGHVRHAFVLSMYFLKNNTPFEDAIFHTLLKGGDTDTNAKIVGNMLGALHGLAGIPEYMRRMTEMSDCMLVGGLTVKSLPSHLVELQPDDTLLSSFEMSQIF